jgi:O-antigen/teichoic acid export membrane protein
MTRSASASRRNIITNATANWIGFVGQVVVALFLTPVLNKALGNDRYGVWSLVESILAYLVLLDFGIGASIVRFVAKFEAVHDQKQVNRVFSTSVCLFSAAGLLALILASATALWILPLFSRLEQHPDLVAEAQGLLLLLGLSLGLGLPLKVFTCVLDALGRYPAQVVVRLLAMLVRTLLLLWVAWNDGGLVALGIVITACHVAEQMILGVLTWWYLPELRFSPRLVDRDTLRHIRGYSIDAFVAMIAGRLMFQTDAIVIGAFLYLDQITFFVMAARLVEYAKDSFRAITNGLMPAVSVLEARGDQAGIRRILFNGTRYMLWLVLPVQLGLMLLGKTFLAVWLRHSPQIAELSYPTLLILATPLTLALPQMVAARILYGTGRLRWYAWAAMIEAIANLALSVAFVQVWGIEGVALGTAIPNIVGSAALIVYICRDLNVRVGDYLRYAFLAPAVFAVPLAAGWWWAAQERDLYSWPALVITGLSGVVAYLMAGMLWEVGLGRLQDLWRRPRHVSDNGWGVEPARPLAASRSERASSSAPGNDSCAP